MNTYCPHCGTLLDMTGFGTGQFECPRCRGVIIWGQPAPEPPTTVVASRVRSRRRRQANNGMLIALVGTLFLVVILIAVGLSIKSPSANPNGDTIGAFAISQQFVKDRLKAPSTAEFPWYSSESVTPLGEERYRVQSYVDSQNSFGAMIRTKYVAIVRKTGDSNWSLESLAID